MKLSRITTNQHGEVVATITLEGFHEMYRFAHHLTMGQVEFGRVGSKIIDRLRRRSTADGWALQMERLHGIAPLASIDWRDRHGTATHRQRLAARLMEIADDGLTEHLPNATGRGDEMTLRRAAHELADLAAAEMSRRTETMR